MPRRNPPHLSPLKACPDPPGGRTMSSNTLSWRIWPVVATVMAVLFITWDLLLVSKARNVQQRIGREVELLNQLSQLNEAYDQLAMVHKVDVNTQQRNWPAEMKKVQDRITRTHDRYSSEPGIAELPTALAPILTMADSLHREVLERGTAPSATRPAEAVFQFMVQRSQKIIDRASRHVHEAGLGIQTSSLSQRWDEAQVLLFMACLMAVVFALLVGVNRRLLVESRLNATQTQIAKRDLEVKNKELRETMLSKEEKEVMLKEIHHRVKNNLQIVRSLIRFQLDQVEDAKVQELFNECINRVGAMALVHEQTYLSKDLANIDVSTYLDRLVRDLIQAYTINTRLTMDVDIQVKTLGVDTLIPLGLLINEIISNSFKYAFAGRDAGTITVHLNGSETEGLHLLIGDDGVGLKSRDGFHRPNSLGMELIHTLAGQLDAGIKLVDGPGTRYELESIRLAKRKVA